MDYNYENPYTYWVDSEKQKDMIKWFRFNKSSHILAYLNLSFFTEKEVDQPGYEIH